MSGVVRGAFPGEPVLELSVRGERPAPGNDQDVIPTALTIAHLADLVRQALEHELPDDTVVIFERSTSDGAARVRVTGAGVRVPVHESNLRPGTPTSTSIGAASVEVRPDAPGVLGEEVAGRPDGVAHRVRRSDDEQGSPWHMHRNRAELERCVIDPQVLDGLNLDAMPGGPLDTPRPVRDNPQA